MQQLRAGGRRTLKHFTACLLGGAVSDALGAPVEFLSIDAIRETFCFVWYDEDADDVEIVDYH
jgi:ADP-ribosylglycohydrolase